MFQKTRARKEAKPSVFLLQISLKPTPGLEPGTPSLRVKGSLARNPWSYEGFRPVEGRVSTRHVHPSVPQHENGTRRV